MASSQRKKKWKRFKRRKNLLNPLRSIKQLSYATPCHILMFFILSPHASPSRHVRKAGQGRKKKKHNRKCELKTGEKFIFCLLKNTTADECLREKVIFLARLKYDCKLRRANVFSGIKNVIWDNYGHYETRRFNYQLVIVPFPRELRVREAQNRRHDAHTCQEM